MGRALEEEDAHVLGAHQGGVLGEIKPERTHGTKRPMVTFGHHTLAALATPPSTCKKSLVVVCGGC